ncbi:MAG: alpha/beta hydrolase [Candidatus Levybacteria bacterium]|nr:alpha/beta hydrolase [Candidatus Levybacteria bacterium]
MEDAKTIIILHGWGLNADKYSTLIKILALKYKVLAPDLPGFGKNLTDKELYLMDYTTFLKDFIQEKKLKNIILLGHSFGGRVIAKFLSIYNAEEYGIKAVIFTGTPLTKRKMSLRKIMGALMAKMGKNVLSILPKSISTGSQDFFRKIVYTVIGEWDYYKADKMSKTFTHIISEDLQIYLDKINVPTLIVWGENDTITPKDIGVKIQKLIANSKLIIVLNQTHKLPYANPEIFSQKIIPFIDKLN